MPKFVDWLIGIAIGYTLAAGWLGILYLQSTEPDISITFILLYFSISPILGAMSGAKAVSVALAFLVAICTAMVVCFRQFKGWKLRSLSALLTLLWLLFGVYMSSQFVPV